MGGFHLRKRRRSAKGFTVAVAALVAKEAQSEGALRSREVPLHSPRATRIPCKLEKELMKQQIEPSASRPLGRRDAMPQFNFWRKDLPTSRVVRATSELLGLVGKHIGVRYLREVHCAVQGIKSHIGNYRDNRFNCFGPRS